MWCRFTGAPDPRGPARRIVSVDAHTTGTILVLDCGHKSDCVSHFTYTVGESHHCYWCGKEQTAAWSEQQEALARVQGGAA